MLVVYCLAMVSVLFLLPSRAVAHPDAVEEGLLSHWAVGAHEIEKDHVEDVTHSLRARVIGKPRTITHGPAQGWWLDGGSTYFEIEKDYRKVRNRLPTREMSVSAWVCVKQVTEWGGICGVLYDTGDREAGWLLGNSGGKFAFALATVGADDGNGKLTYLKAKSNLVLDRWYHVAATYDGKTMRLYVNGVLEGESAEQSGDILYPPSGGVYCLGGYIDDNERHLLEGVLHRVKTYNRVLTPAEIAETVKKNQNMIDYDPQSAEQLGFLVEPYLQFATQTSIVVMSEANHASTMVIEYGTRQPLDRTAEAQGTGTLATARLTGLQPQTTYFYRVMRSDDKGRFLVSPVRSFQTAVKDDMPWSFGIIGDTQRNPEITRKCAEGLYGLRPNMIIHCGDVVDDGFAKNQWLKDLFEPMSKLLAHVPMYPVIGNHENDTHFYYDYFDLPKPEYWYTFKYGNAQFFMVDTNRDTKPGSPQYEWLKGELAKSTATWKFAVHHHPCWSSDNDDYGDTIKGSPDKPMRQGDPAAQPLIELYEKYGLDIGFAGHIHSYERTWPIQQMNINVAKGVRYIVSGGGGGGLEEAAPNRTWFQKHVKRGHHYCFMTVHGRSIQFYAYDTEGRLFDTFELQKPEGR